MMLALRRGPRLLGLLSGPRSAHLRLPAVRACSSGSGSRGPSSSSGNPLVYLDVGADGQPLGRVVLEVRPPDRTTLDRAWGTVPEEPWTPGWRLPGLLGDLASCPPGSGPQFPHLLRRGIGLVSPALPFGSLD